MGLKNLRRTSRIHQIAVCVSPSSMLSTTIRLQGQTATPIRNMTSPIRDGKGPSFKVLVLVSRGPLQNPPGSSGPDWSLLQKLRSRMTRMSWVSVVVERATCLKALAARSNCHGPCANTRRVMSSLFQNDRSLDSSQLYQNATFYVGSVEDRSGHSGFDGFVGQWDTPSLEEPDRTGLGDLSKSCSLAHRRFGRKDVRFSTLSGATSRPPVRAMWNQRALHGTHPTTTSADRLDPPYRYSYLFRVCSQRIWECKDSQLPNNDKIRILAISIADENPMLEATQSLFATLNGLEPPSESEAAVH